jgi:lactose/L-arabinose transport system ATP-binding protein
MSSLTLRKVRKAFAGHEVIKGVDLDIEPGEFIVFVGPSGCGKSTLLRMIAGLEDVTSGDLSIGGKRMNDVDPSERGIAMVFQSYALYPHLTVRENMGFALKFAGKAKDEIERQVIEAARTLELEPLLDRKPGQLSGGQRQRVAIGRAIVRHPEVFLFDEPLSNLDAELRVHMRLEVARLHQRLGATIIYVTHDQVEAMTLADRIVVLRGGIVEQVGAPLELYDDPDNVFVAGFIGSPRMNFLKAVVSKSKLVFPDHGGVGIALPKLQSKLADGTELTAGIRPDHFKRGGPAKMPVKVELVEHLGGETFVYARAGSSNLLTIASDDGRDLKSGDALETRFDPASVLLFDQAGMRLR